MAYLLSQEFVTLLKDRKAGASDGWLKRANMLNADIIFMRYNIS
jgi:hypothetical protein